MKREDFERKDFDFEKRPLIETSESGIKPISVSDNNNQIQSLGIKENYFRGCTYYSTEIRTKPNPPIKQYTNELIITPESYERISRSINTLYGSMLDEFEITNDYLHLVTKFRGLIVELLKDIYSSVSTRQFTMTTISEPVKLFLPSVSSLYSRDGQQLIDSDYGVSKGDSFIELIRKEQLDYVKGLMSLMPDRDSEKTCRDENVCTLLRSFIEHKLLDFISKIYLEEQYEVVPSTGNNGSLCCSDAGRELSLLVEANELVLFAVSAIERKKSGL